MSIDSRTTTVNLAAQTAHDQLMRRERRLRRLIAALSFAMGILASQPEAPHEASEAQEHNKKLRGLENFLEGIYGFNPCSEGGGATPQRRGNIGKLTIEAVAARPGDPLPPGSKRCLGSLGSDVAVLLRLTLKRHRVHFIRHGEGYHNVHGAEWKRLKKKGNPYTDHECPIDPALTPKGQAQAEELGDFVKAEFPDGEPQFVYTSPMRRAVMTALGAFGDRVENAVGDFPMPLVIPPEAYVIVFFLALGSTDRGDRPCT
eukprot:scaffold477_cov355-Pinguiococcus_pyrenoidosus.AAC.18